MNESSTSNKQLNSNLSELQVHLESLKSELDTKSQKNNDLSSQYQAMVVLNNKLEQNVTLQKNLNDQLQLQLQNQEESYRSKALEIQKQLEHLDYQLKDQYQKADLKDQEISYLKNDQRKIISELNIQNSVCQQLKQQSELLSSEIQDKHN